MPWLITLNLPCSLLLISLSASANIRSSSRLLFVSYATDVAPSSDAADVATNVDLGAKLAAAADEMFELGPPLPTFSARLTAARLLLMQCSWFPGLPCGADVSVANVPCSVVKVGRVPQLANVRQVVKHGWRTVWWQRHAQGR